jgi:hypothetical protein
MARAKLMPGGPPPAVSRKSYPQMAMAFIGQRNSAYLATASADGQPYVQHRGGPPGFLKVLRELSL